MRHTLEYGALAGLAFVFRSLPRRFALELGAGLGGVLWTAGLRRRIVMANLAQAMPATGVDDRKRIAARSARNFGRTAVEFLRYGRDREKVPRSVAILGDETLREALGEGRGAIVVTGHVGAWALYVAALGLAGIPTALLIGRQSNPKVHAFIRSLPGQHLEFISQRKAAPRELLRALTAGKAVVLVADQHAGGRGTVAPFFGRETYTMALPAALIGRRNPPLLSMFGHRRADGGHEVVLRRMRAPDGAGESRESRRRRIAMLCNEAIEQAALERPDQYFWFHRRYRPTDPTGPG